MTLDSYLARAVHLTAIWAYGVSQPIYALLDGNPELVIFRSATRFDVLLVMVVVTVVPPLMAVSYAWLAGRFSSWIGDVLYLIFLGAFLIPVALRLLKVIDPSALPVLVLVVSLCSAAVWLYVRSRAVRLFVGYSIVLPVLALIWYWHGIPSLSGTAEAARIEVPHPYPVVVVVLDELPVSSLMTRGGKIDAVRYPAFARLARDGVWYPNATTVHDTTFQAVPAILTGNPSSPDSLPTPAEHPENLFTLLAGGYALRVHESATRLCPPSMCPAVQSPLLRRLGGLLSDVQDPYLTRVLPDSVSGQVGLVDLDSKLAHGSSQTLVAFDTLLEELGRHQADRTLYFAHVLLPHAPWRFLPSGSEYQFEGIDGWTLATESWDMDSWLVRQGYQRHLLQTGYVDLLLGRLLRQLDRTGLYDRALVVVTADHGVSFKPGDGRRPATKSNLADIANVPMFVKYPDARPRGDDLRAARTIDIVPTVADVLGIRVPWKIEGSSLVGPVRPRSHARVIRGGEDVSAPLSRISARTRATVRVKSRFFGEGEDSLYDIGVHRNLLGMAVNDAWRSRSKVRIRVEDTAALAAVDKSSSFVPVRISGVVTDGELSPKTEVAIAVNGVIAALAHPFVQASRQRVRALVPESSLRNGANRVEFFAIDQRGPKLILTRL